MVVPKAVITRIKVNASFADPPRRKWRAAPARVSLLLCTKSMYLRAPKPATVVKIMERLGDIPGATHACRGGSKGDAPPHSYFRYNTPSRWHPKPIKLGNIGTRPDHSPQPTTTPW